MGPIFLVVQLFEVGVFTQVGDDLAPGMGNDKAQLDVAFLQVFENGAGELFQSLSCSG